MLSVNSKYNTIFNVGDYHTNLKVVIDGITYDGDQLISVKTKSALFDSDTPSVGNATSGEIEIEMLKPDVKFSRKAKIVLYASIENSKGVSDWMQVGVYYIDTRKTTYSYAGQDTMTINGYDFMMEFEQTFDISGLTYPISDSAMMTAICSKLGIEMESKTKNMLSGRYVIDDPSEYTYREVIKFIAAGFSGNFIITPTETLKFLPFNSIARSDILKGTFNAGTNAREVLSSDTRKGYSCVYIEDGYDDDGNPKRYYKYDTTLFSSFDEAKKNGQVLKIENDIVRKKNNYSYQQSMVDYVYSDVKGWSYIPYELSDAVIPIHLELGDKIKVNIHPTETIESGIFSLDVEYGLTTTANIKAPFDEEMDHEFSYDKKSKRKSNQNEASVAANTSGINDLNTYTGIDEANADAAASTDEEVDTGSKISLYSRIAKNSNEISVSLISVDDMIELTASKSGISGLKDGETIYSLIQQQSGRITNLVSPNLQGPGFSWTLTPSGFTIATSSGSVLEATEAGLYISGNITTSSTVTAKTLTVADNGTVDLSGNIVSIKGHSIEWKTSSSAKFSYFFQFYPKHRSDDREVFDYSGNFKGYIRDAVLDSIYAGSGSYVRANMPGYLSY